MIFEHNFNVFQRELYCQLFLFGIVRSQESFFFHVVFLFKTKYPDNFLPGYLSFYCLLVSFN